VAGFGCRDWQSGTVERSESDRSIRLEFEIPTLTFRRQENMAILSGNGSAGRDQDEKALAVNDAVAVSLNFRPNQN
jgi:hypothetical protein